MTYDNTNKGVLYPESNRPSDKHPNMTGKININGVEYRLAAWRKTPRGGGKDFLSLAISEFKAQEDRQGPRGAEIDDEIPF